ncbi:MAG: hypothetical protein QXQ46_03050 [Thermoplasmatales archaeon]
MSSLRRTDQRGGQFKLPESFVKWFTVWKQMVDYRELEGIGRKLQQLGLISEYPDYTTIYSRISDFVPEISLPQFSEAEIGTDGSGLKTTNAGEYRILKYGEKYIRRKKHLFIYGRI